MAVMMAVSLAACTLLLKTEETDHTGGKDTQEIVPQSTGGASDKVPDPNVMPVAVVSHIPWRGTLTAWYRIWIPLTQRGWMPSFW